MPTAITADSSPNAAAVYERFGFKGTGACTEHAGVVFVPINPPP